MKRYAILAALVLSLGLGTGIHAGATLCCDPSTPTNDSAIKSGRTITYFYTAQCVGTGNIKCCYCLKLYLVKLPAGPTYPNSPVYTKYETASLCNTGTDSKAITLPTSYGTGNFNFIAEWSGCNSDCATCTGTGYYNFQQNFTF